MHLRRRANELGQSSQYDPARKALEEIVKWLRNGEVAGATLQTPLRHEIANQLLQEGQWRLLQNLMQRQSAWTLTVSTEKQLVTLLQLELPERCSCTLQVTCALAGSSVRQLSGFIERLQPGTRVLSIAIRAGEDARVWKARADLVRMTPGITLALEDSAPRAPGFSEDVLRGLFDGIHTARIHELQLRGIALGGAAWVRSLQDAVRATGARALTLRGGHDAVAQGVLTCQPWERVDVVASAPVASVFASGGVTARNLVVHLPEHGGPQAAVEGILESCLHLETVRILGGHLDLLCMARALGRRRTVHTVAVGLSAVNHQQATEALERLGHNPSLLRVDLLDMPARNGVVPIGAAVRSKLLALTRAIACSRRFRWPKARWPDSPRVSWRARRIASRPWRVRSTNWVAWWAPRWTLGPRGRSRSSTGRAMWVRSRLGNVRWRCSCAF